MKKKITDCIEIILRAIIIQDNQILLCHSSENPPNYYYLPGGHLEKGETLESGLKREIKEEINIKIINMKFLVLKENFYKDKQGNHHEINLLYAVDLDWDNSKSLKAQENHVFISWLETSKLPTIRLLPPNIHKYLIEYLNQK